MEKLKRALREIVTEPNNQTVCPVRLLSIAGGLEFLGLAICHFTRGGLFDAQAFAVGFAALIGGIGAALGMKKDSPHEAK